MREVDTQLPQEPTLRKLPGRPLELILLAGGFLVVSVFGWLRVQQALLTWNWLLQVLPTHSPAYLVFSGAAWGLGGSACALGLWLRLKMILHFTRAAACTLALWYWIERLLLTRSPQGWINWPFSLALTVICLVFVFAVLAHPRQKRFFDRQ
jgi:hypothetical protein